MKRQGLIFIAVVLLSAGCYAQEAAPPAAPDAPQAPTQNQQTDNAKAQAEADKAKAEAYKAQAEARKQAAKARAEAQKGNAEAAKARAEAARAKAEATRARVQALAARSGSYLGVVDPKTVTPDNAAALKLKPGQGGVLVGAVDHDSPAGKAGVKENDVILTVNGQNTGDVDALRKVLRETPAGKSVPLVVSRNGQQMTFNVQLAKRPQYASIAVAPMPPMPPMDLEIPGFTVLQFSRRNGAVVEDLTPQLADFFGVKGGEGVLVRSVDRGSPADAAGLKAGDVVVKVGNENVTSSADWSRAMREHRTGTLALNIVRDKREQSVTIKLPERTSDASIGEQWQNYWKGFDSQAFQKQMQDLERQLQDLRPQIERESQIARDNVRRIVRIYRKDLERELDPATKQQQ